MVVVLRRSERPEDQFGVAVQMALRKGSLSRRDLSGGNVCGKKTILLCSLNACRNAVQDIWEDDAERTGPAQILKDQRLGVRPK